MKVTVKIQPKVVGDDSDGPQKFMKYLLTRIEKRTAETALAIAKVIDGAVAVSPTASLTLATACYTVECDYSKELQVQVVNHWNQEDITPDFATELTRVLKSRQDRVRKSNIGELPERQKEKPK